MGASCAIAVVLAAQLTGCSLVTDGGRVVGIFAEDSSTGILVAQLADDLRALPGVRSVAADVDPVAALGRAASVVVDVEGGTGPELLVEISERTRDVFVSNGFEADVATLSIAAEGVGRFEQSEFSMSSADLENDVRYWRAASNALEAELALALVGGPDGAYSRTITLLGDDDLAPDGFIALAKVPDASAAASTLVLPGLAAGGPIAPEHLELLAELSRAFPLASLAEGVPARGLQLSSNSYPGSPRSAAITIFVDAVGPELRTSEEWPQIRDSLDAVLRSSVPGVEFGVIAAGESDTAMVANIRLSECAGDLQATESDRALFSALLQEELPLPIEAGPGFCQPLAG